MTQLVAPLPAARQQRAYISAGASVLLLALALVAVSTFDGSKAVALTGAGAPGDLTTEAPATITVDDVNLARAQIVAHLNQQPTQIAAHIRGTTPTQEEEAAAIMQGNGPEGEADMARYMAIDGSHASDARVADKIIDDVEEATTDVTGKAGALTYENLLDSTSDHDVNDSRGAWLRGSLPNYRAESNYITSGVVGNYEKELENAPTMAVVNGSLPARTVAYKIVEAAESAATSPDCTGTVDADGVHGVGHGTPPCTAMVSFHKEHEDVDEAVETELEEEEEATQV
jgi:hypothetical protein